MGLAAAPRNGADSWQGLEIEQMLARPGFEDAGDFVASAGGRIAKDSANAVAPESHVARGFRDKIVGRSPTFVTDDVLIGFVSGSHETALDEMRIRASAPGASSSTEISCRCDHDSLKTLSPASRARDYGRLCLSHRKQRNPLSTREGV